MVHALSEASRVLVHKGILIDMRPVTVPLEIEVFVEDDWVGVCALDVSPGLADDEAVRRALAVLRSRCFALDAQETFASSTYWDVAAEFLVHVKETGFRRFVTPADDDLCKVERLMREGGRDARIRLRDLMTIGRYRRAGE